VDSFLAGDDIHARTASEVFGVERDAVTIELRSAAKAINFGLLYGMSAFRLGGDLGIPQKQAAQYIEDYFDRMPTVRGWLEATKELAKENGYVETLFGRRRLLPDIHSGRFNERAAAEREATNTPIQGTAADLIKLAMIKVDSVLRDSGSKARLLLQVHDELLLSVPEDEIERVTKAVSEAMSGVAELAVPLAVNTAVGDNWQQAHG
jgi:DNA polymerase-1